MNAPILWIYRGLPASGKTTQAKKNIGAWRAEGTRVVRVNRDDTRDMLFGGHGKHGVDEEAVTAAAHPQIRGLLSSGVSVISDDTNLNLRFLRRLVALGTECRAVVKICDGFLAVPLEDCIARDAARDAAARVGEQVIRDLHRRYLAGQTPGLERLPVPEIPLPPKPYVPRPGTPSAVLVDIDGTLALMNGRGPFEWHRVGEDGLNGSVACTVKALASAGNRIIVMSGRDAVCRPQTERWLAQHHVMFTELHMRAAGDFRPDQVVKAELFDEHVRDRYNVLCVLDDRAKVVAMWRSLGLVCMQVAPGDF